MHEGGLFAHLSAVLGLLLLAVRCDGRGRCRLLPFPAARCHLLVTLETSDEDNDGGKNAEGQGDAQRDDQVDFAL